MAITERDLDSLVDAGSRLDSQLPPAEIAALGPELLEVRRLPPV
jgi:hypothetical protein